ncbi:MAG: histone deacetylase [Phycisphaerae bacterium]|nr:histone deacetylase [Phycisphaerae bacterium]
MTRRGVGHVWAVGVFLLAIGGCAIPTKPMKEVKRPREGRALGGRVAVVYCKHYPVNLVGFEKLHPFDINKYAHIYNRLVQDGVITPGDVFVPVPVGDAEILRVHTPEFLASLRDSKTVARYLEAPALGIAPAGLIDLGMLSAFRYVTGGTVLAGRLALEHGIAINLGGGYHHAKPDAGEGFCVYADMPIAIRCLQAEGKIRRALVVDLDVHQGNGTAVCLAGDETTFTFSMHQGSIYPIPKATSDLDVELESGTGDARYLEVLGEHLPTVLDRARPDIVFLQAGCDTLRGDPLASLAMTESGIVRRDATVIDACVRRGTPVVMTLGGGYSSRAWYVQYRSVRHTIDAYGRAVSTAGE